MLFQGYSARAATLYWDGTQTNWTGALSGWSTAGDAVTPNPLFFPSVLDDVIFNISTENANQTVNINAGATVNAFSLLFNNTGTTTLQSTTATAATLGLRAGGLTIASGAGTVTIGNTGVPITLTTQGAQTWNLAAGTTLNLGSNITRNSAVFNFTGTGTLAGAATSFNTSATTGIIGAWATYGDDWAVHPAGGSFSAYTGYTTTSGANQRLISGTTLNARLTNGSSGVTAISAADTDINTLLVNDAAARTINNNGNRLRFQGNGGILLATGAGPLTIGAISTASSNTGTFSAGTGAADIYVTNNSSNLLTINSALVNGSGLGTIFSGATSLVKAGTGTVLLANGTINGHVNNTGSFIVQAGTLRLGTSRSLGFVLPGALLTNGFAGNNYTNNLTLNPGTSAATAGTLDLNGFSANIITLSAVAGASGSSTTSTSNNARITNSVAGSSVTLTSALGGATTFFNGIIENGSGTVGLTRVGASGLTLGNANTYTGTTRVGTSTAAGNVTLDFNQLGQFGVNVPSIISSSSALELNGGSTLTVNGTGRLNGANVINTQTFNGTTLSGGSYLAWGLSNTSGLVGSDVLTIDLGAINRVGNATLQIINNTAGGAQVTFRTSSGTANNLLTDANGTVYLTNVNDFWAKDATNTRLVAVTSTNSTATSLSGFANVNNPTVTLAADTTANTLRFSAIANKIVDINGRTLTLSNGGILAVPSGTQTGAWEIRNGSLRGSSGGALSVFHYDTNNTAGLTVTAHTTGASTVTVTAGVANLAVGQAVGGTGIQPGTTITGIAGNAVTLSQPTTAGGTATFPSAIVIGASIVNNTSASALIKSGLGNLVLTNASNSYTGGTFVNGGALTLAGSGVLGSTAPVTISNGGTLAFSRTDANGSPYIFANNVTNNGNVQVNTGAVNFTGSISGDGGFIKAGGANSTVTLSGANTYRGNTNVQMGTLAVGNGGSINTGLLGGNLLVGTVAGQRAVATIGAGASVTVSSVQVGTQATSAGALYQTGGTLASLTPSASDTPFGNFLIGNGGSGSYGYYKLSGGTLAVTQFGVSGNNPGNAVVDITGGTVSTLQGIGLARQGADTPVNAHNFSVLTQSGGIVSTSNGGDIAFNSAGSNNNGTFTLSGGIFGSSTNNSRFNLQAAGSHQVNLRANVNLNGGILQTGGFTVPTFGTVTPTSTTTTGNVIVVSSATNVRAGQLVTGTNIPANTFVTAVSGTNVTLSNAVTGAIADLTFRGTGTATVNFNGGTVKLNQTAATLFPALNGVGQLNSGVYVYGAGATIDTNNFNSISNTPLLAPTGNGVSTITVNSSATGFVGAPVIVLTDTNGVPIPGASAVANMVDDGTGTGTLQIGSIAVTNPGINAPGTVLASVLGNVGVSNATMTAATNSGGAITNSSGTNTITNVDTSALTVGRMVTGTGIQPNTFITAISGNTVTLNNVTTAAVTAFSTYSLGSLTASTAANTSSGGLNKIGLGTLTLNATQGASTYTGATTIHGGGITLDFSTGTAVNTNLINSASELSLSGGTLTLTGRANTTNSQAFASTTLNGGLNTVAANANATANPLLLSLGNLTRNNNATANFVLPTGIQGGTNGITVSNSNNAAGILGTWATVNGTDYAAVSGGNIVAATYTTANDLSTWTSGSTTIYTNSAAFTNSITSTVTIPALRWNTASASGLAIGNGGTLQTDGIFFTNNLGASAGGGITSTGTGVLQTATVGGELVINNSTTTTAQNFLISARITDNGSSSLTKTGPTRVTLTGLNTYAGPTTIVGGSLRADDGTGLPTNSLLTLNGGVFELNTAGTFSRTLGSSAGNVQITGGLSGFSNGGSSASTINLGGSGGTLQWGSTNFNPVTGLVLNSGSSTNAIILANGLDLNGIASRTIYNQGAFSATISGVISNSVSGALSNLTFNANGTTGTIILTGDNTYDGYTTINSGTVQVGNGGTTGRLGTGIVGVGNATLIFNRSDNFTVSNLFSSGNGNGTVTHAGAGTLSLSANNSGFFNLTASGGGTIDLLGNTVNVSGGVYNNSSASSASTVATVNASAGGRIYLSSASPNFGATNGSTGVSTLVINAPIENAPEVNGGAVPLRNLQINPLTGGAGIVVLNGANTYTGRTSIQNGVAQVTRIGRLDNPGTSGSLGVPYLIEQATIQLGNGTTTGTLRYVGAGETTDRAFNLFGTTGGGGLQNDGTSGGLVIANSVNATGISITAKTLTLGGLNTAANTLSGAIVDAGGAASATNATWTNGSQTITLSTPVVTGTFVVGQPITGGAGIPAGAIVTAINGTTSLTISVPTTAAQATAATVTAGNVVNLLKEGTGTWTVSGANTYTGTTTARGGNLILDYTTNDPLSATSAVILDGGTLTFKGRSGGTTDTIASLALNSSAGGTNKLVLDGSAGAVTLTANTLAASSNALASSFIDLSSNAANSLTLGALGANYSNSNSLLVSNNGNPRANIIVKDSTGIGYATISGATSGAVTRIADVSLTSLPASNIGSGTANYLHNGTGGSITVGNGAAAFANNSITVDASAGTATLNLAANGTLNGTTTGLLVRGSNNVTIATAGGANTFNNGTWIVSNYLTGTAALNLNGNLSQTALLQLNGPGLTIYSGTSLGNNQNNGFNLNEGTLRVTTASDWSTLGATGISATATNGWFRNSGGVFEIGADLNGATAGDFTNAIVTAVGANGITFYGDSGVSAFGGNRTVNFGGAGATLIWGTNGFLVDVGATNDRQYAFKLSSAYSNSTVEVQNGINLNARTRVFEVANGSAAVDARLSGNLVGGGVGGIVKNGEGTLALSGTNTYTGVTNVRTGTLQFSRQTALYNNTPANWTAANLVVNSGATVAFNVGGVNEFTTGNVTTLLTNLGGTNGSSTSGFAAGSAIGFDTTNASGSTFTVADNIANSSGIGGGAIGITKLGANTLVLTGTNTYTGNTTVSGGALQVGNAGTGTTGSGAVTVQTGSTLLGTGTVRGSTFDLQNGSTLRPGDAVSDSSYGSLTFTPTANSGGTSNLQGNIILGLSAATTTDATLGGGNEIGSAGYNSWLDGVTGAGNHDQIIFNNPTTGTGYNLNFLTTTGSLQINGNDFTPSFGQVFNLLDWSNLVTTNFSGFSYNTGYLIGNGDEGSDLDLPDLSAVGLVWDFSRFTISGNIAIVPEPSRALLMFVGLCGLLLRRRRR